jgi:hypothetical protein
MPGPTRTKKRAPGSGRKQVKDNVCFNCKQAVHWEKNFPKRQPKALTNSKQGQSSKPYLSPKIFTKRALSIVNFYDGLQKERTWVTEVLIKHNEAIFECSGRYSLFANHVVEVTTIGGPIMGKAVRMNKHKRDITEEKIKEYIEHKKIKPSTPQWNAPSFLLKKPCAEGETRASKMLRMVEDYRDLNKKIKDEVFDTPSLSKLVCIIGSENKYYCLIDLRNGYHHLPLKVNDREKTTFSTGGLAGKLQYPLLLHGSKHGGQVFQHAIERVL